MSRARVLAMRACSFCGRNLAGPFCAHCTEQRFLRRPTPVAPNAPRDVMSTNGALLVVIGCVCIMLLAFALLAIGDLR